MEQQDNGAEVVASPPAGAAKSKLDTLSKEDLIKFAKKQMAAMQKMKTKCADLEKEVGTLKTQSNSSSDESIIQELTERMSAVLLEKAETQQSLVLMRKDNEKAKQQANDALEKLATLQGELDQAKGEHQKKIDALEEAMEICKANHKEEVDHFQKLLWEKEESDREKESEREKEREQVDTNRNVEAIQFSLESQLLSLQKELEEAREQSSRKTAALQEDHQRVLTEAQQEVENLREELAQKSLQHEEELRALEEDSEMERERLLLLHEELTEQLALKDSFLQDVQEEEEEPGRGSGIAKMLELSGCSHSDISDGDMETGRFRGALDDLQSQNTMLQDELTFLGNVKSELEAELERVREEFQMEKEELEFKIDELQMTRESIPPDSLTVNSDQHEQEAPTLTALQESGPQKDQGDGQPDPDKQTLTLEDHQRLILELEEMRAQCEALTMERSSAVTEYEHTRDILRGLEAELGQRTGDFVKQYEAMKEQGASAAQELQERVRGLSEEKDGLLERVKGVSEERDILQERVQGLEQRLEDSLGQTQAVEGLQQQLQASVEEKTALVVELKASVEDLGRQNGEILSQLQLKESAVQELEEMLTNVTTESERVQSLLELREMEVKRLREEREKEVERQKEESSQEHVKTTTLEQTLSGLSREKEDLQQNLEEMSVALTKVAVLEGMLEQGAAEKQQQESRLKILAEDMAALQSKEEQAQVTIRTLQEQSEALGSPTEEVQELQAHVEELEQERSMLRSSLEEAQRERRSGEEQEELQSCIVELEKERAMLKSSLEEVVSDTEALQRDLGEMRLANEKMRGENQELLAQISQASETLAVKEMEEEHMERAKEETDMEKKRMELQQQLTEKDSLVSQLKSEMAALQQSAANSGASQENVASQLTEKIALMEKESKEKDERMNKIKAVAVKARKELDTSRKEVATLKGDVETLKTERERVTSSMKDIIHGAEGYKNLQMDYDRQTEQLDKEKEKMEAAERQMAELTKRLNTAVTQHEQLWSEREDMLAGMETLRNTVRQLEGQLQELHRHTATQDRDLQGERLLKEQKMKELSSAMKEVEELTTQLRKQKQQSQQTAQELEQLRKEAQQSSLMDMEMADYERLVRELNTKLSERDVCVEELRAQIHTQSQREDTLQQEIESLKSQLDQGEEKSSKMKQLLVKTKKDLADAKKQDASQMMLQASLKGELEAHQQQLEGCKIQVCDLTAERHRLQEQLRLVMEHQQRTTSSLQQRITALQEECNTAKAELASTGAEFDSYKVRVHNVLKQQKTKSSAQSDGDTSKQERDQVENMVDQLKTKLQDSQQSLQASLAELQQLQTEHDTLLERHNKILQETVTKEADLRERLLSLQAKSMSMRTEHAQTVGQLTSQTEAQRSGFRDQIRHLQEEHRSTVETLQSQIGRLENQLFTLQSQTSSVQIQSSRKPVSDRRPEQGGMGLALSELQSMAREEGEGMETTETESLSPALTPLPSLEQLLTSPDPKHEPFVWQVEPTKEELSQKLTTATRSMEHMNSLLHETEATNAVLMEQITLLKSEVRRLERNHEREKSVANLEYLKNVLLQFIFLQSGSERRALLPVMHTMLQLSPEEKNKLAAIAQGEDEVGAARGSGWTSYLHSWSGIR